jgi:hypothetical protein
VPILLPLFYGFHNDFDGMDKAINGIRYQIGLNLGILSVSHPRGPVSLGGK